MESVTVAVDDETANTFNVSGTAKYVTGWTAFNSEVEAEQTGHYITLDIARPTAFPVGNTFIIGEKTLETDNDGIRLTTRIDDLADGKVTVKLNWSETEIEEYVLDFSNVTLASAE